MSDSLFSNILFPIFGGLVSIALTKWQNGDASIKKLLIVGISIAFLVLVASILFIPPYRLAGASWCQINNYDIRVDGHIVTFFGNEPATGTTVDVKIFERAEGEKTPVGNIEQVINTDVDGNFRATFSTLPLEDAKNYLVNVVFRKNIFSLFEREYKEDKNFPTTLAKCSP